MANNRIQRFAFPNDEPGSTGLLAFTIDWHTGVIEAEAHGFWAPEQTKAHFAAYVDCVAELHRRGLAALVVVDTRESAAQSQEVAEILRRSVEGLYRPGDRVAMVVQNSIAKMQMRRVLQADFHEYFLSINAARNWAFAHAPAGATRASSEVGDAGGFIRLSTALEASGSGHI